jgi:murein DD-endopeptidase MepM/ murein hydrolase activator NlpD
MMKHMDLQINNEKGVSKIGVILILPFVILLIAYSVYQLFLIPEPVVRGLEDLALLPREKTVQLTGENIKSVHILIYKDDKSIELLKDMPATSEVSYTLQVKPKELGLSEGPAVIIVTARAGFFKEIKEEIRTVIDTVPPSIEVVKSPFLVYRGSGGFAVLRARDAGKVFVRLGDQSFRAFTAQQDFEPGLEPPDADIESPSRIEKHKKAKAKTYLAFFPAPYEAGDDESFFAVAEDAAGNQSIRALTTRLREKQYGSSSITIEESFVKQVLVPLMNEADLPDPAGAFREVNEEWRKAVLERLVELSGKTEPRMLWKGRFLQMKNSKVMAVYGDRRTYFMDGDAISKSVHLGYDLASHSRAPVSAANSGIVKFAGELSIYGNTVIIDHGMGLMSLYGHLSEITVEPGENIKKGANIGRTGSTGLAGGDHLHFGILLHGQEVSPLYWWDSHWIKVNISDVLSSYFNEPI